MIETMLKKIEELDLQIDTLKIKAAKTTGKLVKETIKSKEVLEETEDD